MRYFFVFLCLGLLLGQLNLAQAASKSSSAVNSIDTIQKAIDSSNPQLFSKYVNIDSLLNQALQVLQAKAIQQSSNLPPALTIMALSLQNPSMAESVKKMLKDEATSFLNYQISSGNFAGKPTPQKPPKGMLTPLLQDISTGRKELKVTGKPKPADNLIIVPTTLHDSGNGNDYNLNLALQEINGIWQVQHIDNIQELTTKLQKEAEAN